MQRCKGQDFDAQLALLEQHATSAVDRLTQALAQATEAEHQARHKRRNFAASVGDKSGQSVLQLQTSQVTHRASITPNSRVPHVLLRHDSLHAVCLVLTCMQLLLVDAAVLCIAKQSQSHFLHSWTAAQAYTTMLL